MVVQGRATSRGIQRSDNLIYEAGSVWHMVQRRGTIEGGSKSTRLSSFSHVHRVLDSGARRAQTARAVFQQDVGSYTSVTLRSIIIPLMAAYDPRIWT